MTKVFSVALSVLTPIGGFLDIGDLVTNAIVGSRFGLGLARVVVVGVIGICLYANMAGRAAAVSGRAIFEIIRERAVRGQRAPDSGGPGTLTAPRHLPGRLGGRGADGNCHGHAAPGMYAYSAVLREFG